MATERLVLGLVLLTAPAEPGDVPIRGASAERHDDLRLLSRLADLLDREPVVDADRALDERDIHLGDVAHVGEGQVVDPVDVLVEQGQESRVVISL